MRFQHVIGMVLFIATTPAALSAQKRARRAVWLELTPAISVDTLSIIRLTGSTRALFRITEAKHHDTLLALEVLCRATGGPAVELVQPWSTIPRDTAAVPAIEILRPDGPPYLPSPGSAMHRAALAWCMHEWRGPWSGRRMNHGDG